MSQVHSQLLACRPETVSAVYVGRSDAAQLLVHQSFFEADKSSALEGAIVVADLPGQGFRARQVISASSRSGKLRLCDGSDVQVTQLHSYNEIKQFTPRQLRSLCCELSWHMAQWLSPRLELRKVCLIDNGTGPRACMHACHVYALAAGVLLS